MTIAVDLGRKATKQTNKQASHSKNFESAYTKNRSGMQKMSHGGWYCIIKAILKLATGIFHSYQLDNRHSISSFRVVWLYLLLFISNFYRTPCKQRFGTLIRRCVHGLIYSSIVDPHQRQAPYDTTETTGYGLS